MREWREREERNVRNEAEIAVQPIYTLATRPN
jgi:hypothetical protein